MAKYAPPGILANIDPTVVQETLDAVSDLASSYIGSSLVLPLVAPYPVALVRAVCRIALWDLVSGVRGFNPEAGSNPAFEKNHDTSLTFLKDVGKGQAQLAGVTDSNPTPEVNRGGPRVSTNPRRSLGFGPCR
jgi:phage gp36-like protein